MVDGLRSRPRDWLIGDGGQDILIAGGTTANLEDVQSTWITDLSFSARQELLSDQVSSIDDGVRDSLFGGFARDWTLADSFNLDFDRWWSQR